MLHRNASPANYCNQSFVINIVFRRKMPIRDAFGSLGQSVFDLWRELDKHRQAIGQT